MRTGLAVAAIAAALGSVGCSTWDNMSRQEKGAVIGAGAGGVVGSTATGGSVLGTVGGAAVGGVIGNEVGKRR